LTSPLEVPDSSIASTRHTFCIETIALAASKARAPSGPNEPGFSPGERICYAPLEDSPAGEVMSQRFLLLSGLLSMVLLGAGGGHRFAWKVRPSVSL
jgi:hypothetical protein